MTLAAADFARERPRRALPIASETWVLVALGLFVMGLSFAPLLRLAYTAIAPDGWPDASRLAEILGTRQVFTATVNTLRVALFSTLLSLVVGTLAATLVALTDMRGKALWVFAFILPLMIPPQVSALAWVQAFSPSSPILGLLGLSLPAGGRHPLYSEAGIVLLLGIYNSPLVFLSVRAALRRLPAELVEAGQAAGASQTRLLFTIILPLARAGIFAGAALAFVSSIGNFGIQAMLGIPARFPTLITLIYQKLNSFGPSALSDMAILAMLLAVLTIVGITLAGWLGSRKDVRVDGSARPLALRLGLARLPIEIVAWATLVATLVLPLSALVTTSLVKGFGQKLTLATLTIDNYASALFRQAAIREGFFTSLWLTITTALVLTGLSIFLAYFLTWHRSRFIRVLHLASELAYAIPGIVIGVAMILFFLKPLPLLDFSIYGTVWIILAAYLANFLALSLRSTLGGFAQIDRSLEEAAQVAGAGFLRRMRDIIAPLVAPAAAAGAIIVFMSALNEIQVSILLVSSKAKTLGPMIVFLEEGGSSTLAAAVGCLMVAIVLVLMLTASAFSRFLPRGVLPWQN
ncbi:ABC transporter permease [Kaistia terrae]|uniref:ABC transporter permease n=1 Tax=Kaistia terrae TaxID=537017 RepID=A0ABW0PS84_9HYPH|nr:iron ABC transporter permease [Kaistia terrae]MCX5577786.1 iron ABC transporter permease [Kaistia terrae]